MPDVYVRKIINSSADLLYRANRRGGVKLLAILIVLATLPLGCNKGRSIIDEAKKLDVAGNRAGALTALKRVEKEAPNTPEVAEARNLAVGWLIADALKQTVLAERRKLLDDALGWDSKNGTAKANLCLSLAEDKRFDELRKCLDVELKDMDSVPQEVVAKAKDALATYDDEVAEKKRKAASICADLSAWEKPFLENGTLIGDTFKRFRRMNANAGQESALASLKRTWGLGDENVKNAEVASAAARTMKLHGVLPGEEKILEDLVKGWETEAAAYAAFGRHFKNYPSALAEAADLDAETREFRTLADTLVSVTHQRCDKLRAASAGQSDAGIVAAPDSSAGGMVTLLIEHLKTPQTWRVQAAANGAKPPYELPCTTSPNGSFSCRDKCGENSGEIRVSPDTETGPWSRTSDATQIILSFKKLCGREVLPAAEFLEG